MPGRVGGGGFCFSILNPGCCRSKDCEEKTNELRGLQAEVAKAGAKGGGSATAEQVKQVAENATGFAFLHVLIVGLVAFVFGRFFG